LLKETLKNSILFLRISEYRKILLCRSVLMKWGYYLELKSEADQLVEVTRSRFPAREEVAASRSHIGEDKAHSAAIRYNFFDFCILTDFLKS
jgi:hypothetical protein